MGKKVKYLIGLFAILVVTALVFNCAPEKLTGELVPNAAPLIKFTNLPLEDSVFSSSAVVRWYGRDTDGLVDAYYYKVVLKDSISDIIDTDSMTNYINTVFITDVLDTLPVSGWNMTPSDSTAVNVKLFADTSETDTLQQFIFLKCKDDRGDYSETIFMRLFRVNHIPDTQLDLLPGNFLVTQGESTYVHTTLVWSLPDTNALWTGFQFSWEGNDTLDFPEGPPDFQYEWKLYGPYDTMLTELYDAENDTILLSIDNVLEEHIVLKSCGSNESGYVYGNEDCDDPWVWDKRMNWRNLPTGVYLLSVTVRDDADVPDPTPAWGTFACIQPSWISDPENTTDILLIQATQYYSGSANNIRGWPYQYWFDPDDTLHLDTTYVVTEVNSFYSQMIEGAGNYTHTIYGDPAIGNMGSAVDIPPMSVLATHRMVIVDDMDYLGIDLGTEESDPLISVLRDYMIAGGKAWVIGRQSFMNLTGNNSGEKDFDPGSLAVDFFDLSSAFYAVMNRDSVNVEFIGATSTFGEYNDLTFDSTRTFLLKQYGLNKVEAFIRISSNSSTMFTYVARNPDLMPEFHLRPCALKYAPEHGVYKSSYFSFPLFMMDNSNGEVQTIFTDMLSWFIIEE